MTRQTSIARGDAWIFLDSDILTRSSFISPLPPTSGEFVFSDIASAAGDGAAAQIGASIRTSITSSQFTGSGTIIADSSQTANTGAGARGSSDAQITFTLLTPHRYSYAADFVLETEGTYPGLTLYALAGLSLLDPTGITMVSDVFLRQLAHDSRLPVPGSYTLSYSGVLGPGRYALGGGVMSMFQHTTPEFPSARGRMTFDYVLQFSPAADPVPEPATLVLLASGLCATGGRAWMIRRRRRRSTGDQ